MNPRINDPRDMDFDAGFRYLAQRSLQRQAAERLRGPRPVDPEDLIDGLAAAAFDQLSPVALAATVAELQGKRDEVYHDLHGGFNRYKETARFELFTMGISKRFAALSKYINTAEYILNDKQLPELAQCVNKIQLADQEKLRVATVLIMDYYKLGVAQKRPEPDAAEVERLDRSVTALAYKRQQVMRRLDALLVELFAKAAERDPEGAAKEEEKARAKAAERESRANAAGRDSGAAAKEE